MLHKECTCSYKAEAPVALFDAYELALQTVTGAFTGMKRQAGESTSDLATRIETGLKELRQKQNKQ